MPSTSFHSNSKPIGCVLRGTNFESDAVYIIYVSAEVIKTVENTSNKKEKKSNFIIVHSHSCVQCMNLILIKF